MIENLNWSAPVKVNTVKGPRMLSKAVPSPAFWAEWRSNKAALQSAGISCRPISGSRDWEVIRWSEVALVDEVASDAAISAVAAVAEYPAGARVSRPARLINGFSPSELDSSRAWSDEQLAIFNHFRSVRRNLVVQARAGTGKTTTIRVAFSQAPEESMLYAVFNKKNQLEAAQLIQDPRVEVKTLHSVGFFFIQSFWPGVKPSDEVEAYRAGVACGPEAPVECVSAVKKLVAFAKNQFVEPSIDDLLDLADARGIEAPEAYAAMGWSIGRIASAARKSLDLAKVRDHEGRISFDDMVWLPVVKGWVHPRYDLVCVDEAQDMNLPQLLIARGSVRRDGRVIVVGDDRQAIYGFRGAAQDGMAMMQRELDALVLGLTITYRCPKSVVALAAKYVPDYRAADSAPEGEVLHLSEDAWMKQIQVGDAILSRANAPLMPLCLSLLRRGISARIEGRDIGKQLSAIVNKMKAKSVPDFIRRVSNWADKQKARASSSKHAEARCQTIDDQAATLIAVAEGAANVAEVLSRLNSLFQDTDGNSKPAVILSSVHKAKGLEWNRVALVSETFKKCECPGEEQNIFYVACTRAKKTLVFLGKAEQPENN
jgi:hypothetical protein